MSENTAKDNNYHHGNLREAMIDASLDILKTDGIAGLSLRKAALAVGVSHTAPKNHFSNINGLYTALAAKGYHDLATEMGMGQSSCEIAQVFTGYVHFAIKNADLFELMFTKRKLNLQDGAFQIAVGECRGILDELVLQIIEDAADEAEYERVKIQLWSFVHGLAQLTLSGVISSEKLDAKYIQSVLPEFAKPSNSH